MGRLQLFGPADADGPSLLESDRAYCSAVGERISRLLRLSHDSGIGAVRLERVNNLAGREEYVCLYRQALIGSSHNRCAVTLPNLNSPAIAARVVYIGRTFWLENLGEPDTVQLNGQSLQPLQLAPLSISDSLLLGGAHCRFELADQYDGSDEDK